MLVTACCGVHVPLGLQVSHHFTRLLKMIEVSPKDYLGKLAFMRTDGSETWCLASPICLLKECPL
jgi:hypothetical protein